MLSDTAGLTPSYEVRARCRAKLDRWLWDNGFRLVKAGRAALRVPPRPGRDPPPHGLA